LANVNPSDLIGDRGNFLVGFASMSHRNDRIARALCLFGKDYGKLAAASDETKGFHGLKRNRPTGK
jgi:hypothetical protein